MKTAALVASLVAAFLSADAVEGRVSVADFVGTSPCGPVARRFIGGIGSAAACDAITWRVTLATNGTAPTTWKLAATYKIPAPGRPGQVVDGPRVALEGTWEATGVRSNPTVNGYRLKTGAPERSLHLAQISDDIFQLVSPDKRLMVGNSGWSYTLNRADRAEKTGSGAPAPDLSYTISPRATGPVFAVFEGRTPCRGIARELNLQPIAGCIKVKWRVTLNRDARTGAPTTYQVEGTLHRQRAREGTWSIFRGTTTNPAAVVYRLGPTKTEAALHLLKGDDNVVFVLDRQQRLMIGNADYSYTLHRVPGT